MLKETTTGAREPFAGSSGRLMRAEKETDMAKKWKTKTDRSNFYQRYYGSMVGGMITKVGKDSEGFFHFEVRMSEGHTLKVEISADEEGNGPGFLFGLENPYDVERAYEKKGKAS